MPLQDAVTRGAKFCMMYKRPGHRVIINADGDLIVRPSFIEASVQRRPGASSVSHHLLTTYVRSYLAVIRSQFSCKAIQGGREVPFAAAALSLNHSVWRRAAVEQRKSLQVCTWQNIACAVAGTAPRMPRSLACDCDSRSLHGRAC